MTDTNGRTEGKTTYIEMPTQKEEGAGEKLNKGRFLFAGDEKDYGTVILNYFGKPKKEFNLFAEAFHRSAREAADQRRKSKAFGGLHASGIEDFLAYPIVFLYRHALELYMKAVILAGAPILNLLGEEPINEEALLRTHNLETLRQHLVRIFRAFGWDWDMGTPSFSSSADFQKVIAELQSIDAGSDAFRYPVDTKGNSSLSNHFQFNVFDFCEVLDPVFTYFDGAESLARDELYAIYQEDEEMRHFDSHYDTDYDYDAGNY